MALESPSSPQSFPYDLPTCDDKDFIEKKLIGSGGFSEVYKVCHKNLGVVAAKYFKNYEEKNKNEIVILLRCNKHPCITQIYRIIMENDDLCLGYLMEYMPFGSLSDVIHRAEPYDNLQIYSWINQAGRGLEYLHENYVLHRDIKPSNMLLDPTRKLKLADFGLSREFDIENMKNTMTKGLGTTSYQAPEVYSKGERYHQPAEVYAFSVSIWEIIHRKEPYHHLGKQTDYQLLTAVDGGERPRVETREDSLTEILELVKNGWDKDPDKRPAIRTFIESSLKLMKKSGSNAEEMDLPNTMDSNAEALPSLDSLSIRSNLSTPVASSTTSTVKPGEPASFSRLGTPNGRICLKNGATFELVQIYDRPMEDNVLSRFLSHFQGEELNSIREKMNNFENNCKELETKQDSRMELLILGPSGLTEENRAKLEDFVRSSQIPEGFRLYEISLAVGDIFACTFKARKKNGEIKRDQDNRTRLISSMPAVLATLPYPAISGQYQLSPGENLNILFAGDKHANAENLLKTLLVTYLQKGLQREAGNKSDPLPYSIPIDGKRFTFHVEEKASYERVKEKKESIGPVAILCLVLDLTIFKQEEVQSLFNNYNKEKMVVVGYMKNRSETEILKRKEMYNLPSAAVFIPCRHENLFLNEKNHVEKVEAKVKVIEACMRAAG